MDTGLDRENSSLRQQLESLLTEARVNEEKLRRFDHLERRLMAAASLEEVLRLILSEYGTAFGIEYTTLALVDSEYEIARLLVAEGGAEAFPGLLLIPSADHLEWRFGSDHTSLSTPRLEPFSSECHKALFGSQDGQVASVALLPLVRQGQLMGCLYLGSRRADRYVAGVSTDFLERLAAIMSICLENVLTRERLKQMGLTDGLTGVQNRRYFEHRCGIEISQAFRHQHPLGCMLLDIDHFKSINDTYGHQTGDAVLRGIADLVRQQLRTGDTLARYGGEEFVILLPQTAPSYVEEIAERIRARIESRLFDGTEGRRLPVTVSIGISMLALEVEDVEIDTQACALVAAADRALYLAKGNGRNRIEMDSAPNVPSHPTRRTWNFSAQGVCALLGLSEGMAEIGAGLVAFRSALSSATRWMPFTK